MIILSINAGSSSLKFSIYKMPEEEKIASGLFERIGLNDSKYSIKYLNNKYEKEVLLENHVDAVLKLVEELINLKIITDIKDIEGIGNRVVQGGDKFFQSVIVDDKVIEGIKELYPLGPLHNPGAISGILAFKNILPNVKSVAVFDTSFHQTIEKENYLYPVPKKWYEDLSVRKYGFHGTSHRYLTDAICKELNNDNLKIITCHLGNGASISAIKDKKCIDTTMGFTPLAGIMMGSRSGNIDPSIVPYVMEKLNLNSQEMSNILNKQSGICAITDGIVDFRDLEVSYKKNESKAITALKMFTRRIVDFIASYYCLLNKADVIIFSAGIGENSSFAREQIISNLSMLDIYLDHEKNNNIEKGKINLISSDKSKVLVYVIPTDEELMIAKDTYNLIVNS